MAVEAAGVRDWWLRTVLVLQAPRPVFVALREDSSEATSARSEQVLLVVWLAGIASVLSTPTAARLMDDHEYDGLLVAVWAFLAGGLYGGVAYWVFGAFLYGGVRALGSQGSYRRSRHVLAFASVPLALSLVLWPVKLALYGADVFHEGGADAGAGGVIFVVLGLGFLLWTVGLLVLGVRAVHGWSWARAAAAVATAAAMPVLVWLALSSL
ncbi:MAG TPA: Yip1 family protein [Gaiellaceae bacterium]|jgi:hypothetical protein